MARHSWLLLLPMGFCLVGLVAQLVVPALPALPVWLTAAALSAGAILLDRWLSTLGESSR
jgi:hypothetical protein